MTIKINLFGSNGRLGRSIAHQMTDRFIFSDEPDLYIDASVAQAVETHLAIAKKTKRPIVIGVTGLTNEVHVLMGEMAESIPIFYASNFSLGIALLKHFAREIAPFFLDKPDIDLIETHHVQKKDAPSGTALEIAKILQERGKTLNIHSIRSGQIVGKHELIFNTGEEEISITHRAHTRDAFAKGCLAAASFLLTQPPGLYGMSDLLLRNQSF